MKKMTMMDQAKGICVAVLTAALVFPSGVAQAAQLAELDGQWQAAETADEAAERQKAIKQAASSFPPMARGKAKNRLNERTAPAPNLEIAVDGKRVHLIRDGRALELELGAEPKVVEQDGKQVQISAIEEGGHLVVQSQSEDGNRTATYRTVDTGHMRLEVRINGGRLKSPLVYAQTYSRTGK